MRIVVDIGSAQHGGDQSIPHLIREFAPDVLYGLDPQAREVSYEWGSTLVMERPWAAWTHHGTVGFEGEALRGHVSSHGTQVPCVDLAEFLTAFRDDEVLLKMDAEGAEYVLLPYLQETSVDAFLRLAWVEWHCPKCGTGWFSADDRCGRCEFHEPGKRSLLEGSMGCEMHQWNL